MKRTYCALQATLVSTNQDNDQGRQYGVGSVVYRRPGRRERTKSRGYHPEERKAQQDTARTIQDGLEATELLECVRNRSRSETQCKARQVAGFNLGGKERKARVARPVTRYPPRFSRFSVLGFHFVSGLEGLFLTLSMASGRISAALTPQTSTEWRAILRATLRECSSLPDPVARTYMHDYVLSKYRKKPLPVDASRRKKFLAARKARKWLSILTRANEGYQKPLEKVLHNAYGRSGARRREYLRELLYEVPPDTDALKELVNQPLTYGDGWQPPAIISALIKSQMNNPIVQARRVRPPLKSAQPLIPRQDSWGEPVSEIRQRNIRRKWYIKSLSSLMPPLPKEDLATLDGLISGNIPWAPPQRRKGKHDRNMDNAILQVLTDGPQKGHTFRDYADGRPHAITSRFMRRQWMRLSCLVPRMHWNKHTSKVNFTWDIPKPVPRYAFQTGKEMDFDRLMDIVEEQDEPERLEKEHLEAKDPLPQTSAST